MLPSGLSALAFRDFRLIWFGLVASNLGSSMQQLGLGWLLVELAQQDGRPELVPLYVGLVGLARGVPVVLVGPMAGVVADRMDRKRLLLTVQTYWAIVSACLALLVITNTVTIGWVMGLTVLSAVAQVFDNATRNSVYPRLVPNASLISAVGLNSMSFNVAQFIGPMIGGLLIGPIGAGGLIVLNAFSFLALIYALIIAGPLGGGEVKAQESPLRSLKDSFEFVWHEPTIRWTMLLSLLGNMMARPFNQLLPAFVANTLHGTATDLSFLLSAAGIGALIGAFGTASLGSVQRRGVVFACAGIVLGSLLAAFGMQHLLLLSVGLCFLVAMASQMFVTMATTLYHTHTPDHYRGRVMGLSTVTTQGGISTGSMVIGGLGALIGINVAISIMGGLYALLAGGALLRGGPLRQETVDEPTVVSQAPAPVRS
jgi:MFS family permease